MGVGALLLAWFIGGFTVVPTLIFALWYLSPRVDVAATHLDRSDALPKPTAEEVAAAEAKGEDTAFTGAVIARRTYEPSKEPEGTYAGMVAQGYRSFVDARSKDAAKRPRPRPNKDAYHATLKGSVLFLYDTEPVLPPSASSSSLPSVATGKSEVATAPSECLAVIDLASHDVALHPIEARCVDGELFMKRTAVVLRPRSGETEPWYIFPRTNSDKEDLYFALVAASKSAGQRANDSTLFDPKDMAALVAGIDASPDPIPTRWLNAILGRLFLSVYRTDAVEAYIVERIVRKLGRVQRPSYLGEIHVREVSVGRTVPQFSRPMLKALSADGVAEAEVHVSYAGFFRITIETVATISLGARFKPYTVQIVLAIILRELEGTLLLRMKPPPSNRLWFAFTSAPRVVLSVEPVVSTRQIKWSMITKPIESRIREVVRRRLERCPS